MFQLYRMLDDLLALVCTEVVVNDVPSAEAALQELQDKISAIGGYLALGWLSFDK